MAVCAEGHLFLRVNGRSRHTMYTYLLDCTFSTHGDHDVNGHRVEA